MALNSYTLANAMNQANPMALFGQSTKLGMSTKDKWLLKGHEMGGVLNTILMAWLELDGGKTLKFTEIVSSWITDGTFWEMDGFKMDNIKDLVKVKNLNYKMLSNLGFEHTLYIMLFIF